MNNRTIKFKAWSPSKKQMSRPFSLYDWAQWNDMAIQDSIDEMRDPVFLQYTGAVDKNGREVYEGDLLSRDDKKNIREIRFSNYHAAFVGKLISEAEENLKYSGQLITQEWISDLGVAVIGNIYEHADQLK